MSLKKNIIKIYKTIIYKFKPKTNLDNKKINLSSLNELFNHFGTDKGTKVINPYYKGAKDIIGHGYAKFYEEHLKYYKDKDLSLLEIGTWKGGSAASFFYYLKKARIFCLDINFKFEFSAKRIEFFNCNTNLNKDIKKLDKFLIKKQCKNFDIIIDDGSHLADDIIESFQKLYPKLNKDGIYVIEDLKTCNNISYIKSHFKFKNRKYSDNLDKFIEMNSRDRIEKFYEQLKDNKIKHCIEITGNSEICFIYK